MSNNASYQNCVPVVCFDFQLTQCLMYSCTFCDFYLYAIIVLFSNFLLHRLRPSKSRYVLCSATHIGDADCVCNRCLVIFLHYKFSKRSNSAMSCEWYVYVVHIVFTQSVHFIRVLYLFFCPKYFVVSNLILVDNRASQCVRCFLAYVHIVESNCV